MRGIVMGLVALVAGCSPAADPGAQPGELAGTLVYVSNHPGNHCLFARRLPQGEDRRLTAHGEDTLDPAVSPDGRRVAFAMGGRIGVARLDSDEVRFYTLGIEWQDASPAWLPDGQRLIVTARSGMGEPADLHLLTPPGPDQAEAGRRPLLQTPGLDEQSPAVAGDWVVFIRNDQLYRIGLEGGRARRLTSGFRSRRAPSILPSGRVAVLFSREKTHGIEVLDIDGRNHQTLSEGTAYYRDLAASPDGRHYAATFSHDLGSDPTQLMRIRQTEELHLLDAAGSLEATLFDSAVHSFHSPAWAAAP